ncbi:hypothetical protein Tco_0946833 [Tanacetum coccineum]
MGILRLTVLILIWIRRTCLVLKFIYVCQCSAIIKIIIRVKIILWVTVRFTVRVNIRVWAVHPIPLKTTLPFEEVAPVKAKKVSKRRQKARTTENHEASKPWITMKEVALYKAWIDVSENNIRGNAMKTRGFWFAVLDYFGKEMREHVRGYDANTSKWKNRVQKYEVQYDHDFTLDPCWRILKDRVAWKHVEILSFYKQQNKGYKKAKAFETTSDLAHGALNLNEEADGYGEEVRGV